MGLASRFLLKFENDNVDANNFQEYGIELGSDVEAIGVDVVAAQIIAYAGIAAKWTADQHTKLVGMSWVPQGENLSVPIPWPTTAYGILHAANTAAFPKLQGVGNVYGTNWGETGNPLAPLGTSIVVTEYSSVGGPAGRGRHYLPFVGAFSVTGGGFVNASHRTAIEDAYNAFILVDGSATGLTTISPVIENAGGTATKPILNVKAQPVFSNLKSRRR